MNEFLLKHKLSFQSYLYARGLGYRARGMVNGRLWRMGQRLRVYIVFREFYKQPWID